MTFLQPTLKYDFALLEHVTACNSSELDLLLRTRFNDGLDVFPT